MSDWSPDKKMEFLDKATAEAMPYPGDDSHPTFDNELDEQNNSLTHRGVQSRKSEIARLHVLRKKNSEICEILGYTPVWISRLINHDEFVKKEIARYRQLYFDGEAADIIREMALDGLKIMYAQIMDPKEKPELRASNSKWAAEMHQGKAKQAVDHQSSTLQNFMDMLKADGRSVESLDVTPQLSEPRRGEASSQEEPVRAKWEAWITENLP